MEDSLSWASPRRGGKKKVGFNLKGSPSDREGQSHTSCDLRWEVLSPQESGEFQGGGRCFPREIQEGSMEEVA